MKAFFIEISVPFWIQVAINLKKNYGIEPVYWTGANLMEKKLREVFPNITFHEEGKAKRNIPPIHMEIYSNSKFSDDCASVWHTDAQLLYDMQERPNWSCDMSFQERRKTIYDFLIYWNSLLDSIKPEVVFFNAPPHVTYDYVILCLCRLKNIKTMMFEEIHPLYPYSIRMSDYKIGDSSLAKKYSEILDYGNITFSEKVNSAYSRLKGNYNDAKPPTEIRAHKSLKRRTYKDRINDIFNIIKSFITTTIKGSPRDWFPIGKERRVSFKNSYTSKYRQTNFLLQTYRGKEATEQLYKYYQNKATQAIEGEQYIYFPLAGQPERTSNPQGDIYTYQILAVNRLATSLPPTWKLYIKEHPNHFHPDFRMYQYRNEEFYDACVQFENVRLLTDTFDPFHLIDKAQAIATLAGTTGIEALVRGKPVLSFGTPWYRFCKGVFEIRSQRSLERAINEIVNGFRPTEYEVKSYLTAIEKAGFTGIADQPEPHWGIDEKENIKVLTREIGSFLLFS